MATLIPVDGPVRVVLPANGEAFTLRELQRLVGGDIQLITAPAESPLGGKRYVVLNEYGKIDGLPVNHEATTRVGHWLMPGDYIVGPAIVCTWAELGG